MDHHHQSRPFYRKTNKLPSNKTFRIMPENRQTPIANLLLNSIVLFSQIMNLFKDKVSQGLGTRLEILDEPSYRFKYLF
jgi:hypothetical protein